MTVDIATSVALAIAKPMATKVAVCELLLDRAAKRLHVSAAKPRSEPSQETRNPSIMG